MVQVAQIPMRPCPFCNDERPAIPREEQLEFEPKTTGPIYFCECVCCGAQGPYAKSEEGARVLWNMRHAGPVHQWLAETKEFNG